MSITRNQIALLHVAKSRLGLNDARYRTALVHIAGATTSKDLDTSGFQAVLGVFQYMGFAPLSARGVNYSPGRGMASFAQIELIQTLWHEYTCGEAGEEELNTWPAVLENLKHALPESRDGPQDDYRAQGNESPRGVIQDGSGMVFPEFARRSALPQGKSRK